MSVREAFGRQDEIMAQNDQIGVPSEAELQNSENVVYVHAYTKEDGTHVRAHWRSLPDGDPTNNYSFHQSTNSSQGGTITGGAADSNLGYDEDPLDYIMSEIYGYPPVDVSTPEKVQKLMYPDEVVGVKRKEPKTMLEVAQRLVNPHYGNFANDDYTTNCQSCVIAAHLQLMGIDVQAGSGQTQKAQKLANDMSFGYLNPETGKICVPDILDLELTSCSEYLNNNAPANSLYVIGYSEKIDESYVDKTYGHVINLGKDKNGVLFVYDGQNNVYLEGQYAIMYMDEWINKKTLNENPDILRVDNKIINPYYINSVVVPHDNF